MDRSRPSPREDPRGGSIASTAGRSVVTKEQPDYSRARELPEKEVTREWEHVTIARPVDVVTTTREVPVVREVTSYVPKVQVREVVKEVMKKEPTYIDKDVEVKHRQVVEKYVEVPVYEGTEYKYVPRIEVQERTIKTPKPEIKWIEKRIEVPQVKEVVRYVESNDNVEHVIRYVPKGIPVQPIEPPVTMESRQKQEFVPLSGAERDSLTPARHVALDEATPRDFSLAGAQRFTELPPSPRLDKYEQLFVPKVVKTVEVRKDVPVTVDVPVPFMVPKPVEIDVDVPVLRFRDRFVPVPVRRHVMPKVMFTDEVYEVECIKEKPVLVVEDHVKPIPCDVQIKLKEKDIKIAPMDPAELAQADLHAMWMRVNADLLDQYRDVHGQDPQPVDTKDSKAVPADKVDYGPLPLHPGHPLSMTFLQSQWIQNPSTLVHNMYTPELFRMHIAALNAMTDPQPHQINLTEEQAAVLGPLPQEQLPSPWDVSHLLDAV